MLLFSHALTFYCGMPYKCLRMKAKSKADMKYGLRSVFESSKGEGVEK
jgi:hypothetical protein